MGFSVGEEGGGGRAGGRLATSIRWSLATMRRRVSLLLVAASCVVATAILLESVGCSSSRNDQFHGAKQSSRTAVIEYAGLVTGRELTARIANAPSRKRVVVRPSPGKG